jgi:hypothetical protein
MNNRVLSVEAYKERCERKPRRYNTYPPITESIPQFKERFNYTAAEHEWFAKKCLVIYIRNRKEWNELHNEAADRYKDDSTQYIAAIGYCEKAPEGVKERLRELAYNASVWSAASYAHWRAAGKQTPTWRTMLNEMMETI